MHDLVGTRVSHYRIVEFLSKGGMGDVYVAFDEKLSRKVVLKTIRADHRLIDQAKVRFQREARMLSKLAHPNICQIFDYIEGSPLDFIVLELIPGQSLTKGLKQGLDFKQRFLVAEQIAEVLATVHAQGIVHRDLKPDNIMLAEGNQVKVLDFGLSRSLQDEAMRDTGAIAIDEALLSKVLPADPDSPPTEVVKGKLTEVGMIMGTIQYMSPEQARGDGSTPASDLYSFGLILQELFTGKPGYDRNLEAKALQRKVGLGETLPAEGIDPDLISLIERLKSLAPAARPTAVDVLERLRWIQRKPARRRKKVLLAGAVGVLALFTVSMVFQTLRAVRAERKARDEAQAAKQVSEFLVGIFEVSDPDRSKGDTVTAREILDRGARRIDLELRDQPVIQARLMHTMGNVYVNLGLYSEAEALHRLALRTRERILAADHPDVALSLNHLALVYKNQGRYAEAEPLYRRSLTILEQKLGPVTPEVAELQNNLAVLYQFQGRYSPAEPLFRKALEIREQVLDPGHSDLATSLSNLARLYYQLGRFAEAEPLYQRALAIYERVLGPDHPDLGTTINNLAALYYKQKKYAAAEPLFQRALKIKEKTLGSDHPNVTPAMNNLAMLMQKQGKRGEAEVLLRRCLQVRERALGPDHPDVATSLNNLAELLREMTRFAEAEPLYRRSLQIRERTLGAEHPDVAQSLFNLACLYQITGRRTEAGAMYRRSLKIRERALAPDHPDVVESRQRLAAFLQEG